VTSERCKGSSNEGQLVPVLDYTHDVPDGECPIACEPFRESYALSASPCGHVFSVGGLSEYLRQATIPEIIAVNRNPESKDSFPFLVKCLFGGCTGSISINGVRIFPKIYRILKRWATIEHEKAMGAIFCGLPTHVGDVPSFIPETPLDKTQMRVRCTVCEVDICRAHGTAWELGKCPCLPKKSVDPGTIAQSIIQTLNKGNFQFCPGCNFSIQREDKCTHMQCPQDHGGCGITFCYFCSNPIEFMEGSTFKSYHNEDWASRKDRCVWFLFSHPLFLNKSDEEQTKLFQYYKTLRLLRELRAEFFRNDIPEGYDASEWEDHLKEVWDTALKQQEHLWLDQGFNYIEGLKTDFPAASDFECSLP